MSKTKEILRHKWLLGRTHREVARSLSVSAGVVGSMLARAAKAGLTTWAEVEHLDDAELDGRLYGLKLGSKRPLPACAWIRTERSKPGVTLQLLHHEYLEPAGRRVGVTTRPVLSKTMRPPRSPVWTPRC